MIASGFGTDTSRLSTPSVTGRLLRERFLTRVQSGKTRSVREVQRLEATCQDFRLAFLKTFAKVALRSVSRPRATGALEGDGHMRVSRTRSARVVSQRRFGAFVAAALALSLGVFTGAATAAAPASASYQEPFRPQFHFTPAQNWMNDPNGLVYYKGEYHLFYQHNPFGNTWGHMSWGHAVSRDLVHWKHLPVAIAEEGSEAIFSGSAVVDHRNTSGFGTRRNPPMVAIYTSAYPDDQEQSLAYSTDRGRTWTKYAGNPVLDDADREFRDPKVFWYEPDREWRMVVVKAVQRKVAIYRSEDLKSWTHLSDFGPANAVGGVWECPDLFPLPVDGNRRHKKWVMVVSLNPGGIAGGSGMQYFVGDFDGTRFTADNVQPVHAPRGRGLRGLRGRRLRRVDRDRHGVRQRACAPAPCPASRRCPDSPASAWSTASWTSTPPRAR